MPKLKYSKKSLSDLLSTYYSCTSRTSTFSKKVESTKFEISALAGMSISNVDFSSPISYFDYLTKPNHSPSISYTFGVGFDAVFPRNQGKWSINNELFYSSYLFNTAYSYHTGVNTVVETKAKFSSSLLRFNSMVRYKFLIKDLSIYVNGGMSLGFRLSSDNSLTSNATTGSTTTTSKDNALIFNKYELNLLAGIGAKYKKFSLEVRHQPNITGIDNLGFLDSKLSINSFLLGYRLK